MNLVHLAIRSKHEPDDLDWRILQLLATGKRVGEVARELQLVQQSVTKRIMWMLARRWITDAGRVLTAAERERLLESERMLFPRYEILMEGA